MKNLFKIKESLVKSIFLFLLLLAPSTVFAETNFSASKWTYHCNKNNVCFLGVKAELDEQGSKKEKRTLATLIIQLVDNVPVLFARLPLNTDLKKNPLVTVDKQNVGYLQYSHCNNEHGCTGVAQLADDVSKKFKSGNELIITLGIGGSKNMSILFPLKNFSKAYKKLIR
jgi:invasion protein IalB